MARAKAQITEPTNNYFSAPKPLAFVKSGCTLLDCALGGGWALGRIANVVGDKSTAKTALAVEALTNFVRTYPNGKAAYRDAEAAFDEAYAEALGLPLEKVDFGDPEKPITTVEEFYADLDRFVSQCSGHGIYVLDSLDALTTEVELKNDFGDQGFGQSKAKLLSELFRKLTHKIENSKVLLLIVSQVRDNIGAMFGEKHKRSGGRSLDFYASQIVWLARKGNLERTFNKMKRVYGVQIIANVKKNKVGLPHRKCEFEFHFGFGVEDLLANYYWLNSQDRWELGPLKLEDLDTEAYHKLNTEAAARVREVWAEVENNFLPTRKKYT